MYIISSWILFLQKNLSSADSNILLQYCYRLSDGKEEFKMQYKPLPIGTDDFKKLITNGYYYIDKTLLIKELLDKKSEPLYPATSFWKNFKHEHATVFF